MLILRYDVVVSANLANELECPAVESSHNGVCRALAGLQPSSRISSNLQCLLHANKGSSTGMHCEVRLSDVSPPELDPLMAEPAASRSLPRIRTHGGKKTELSCL